MNKDLEAFISHNFTNIKLSSDTLGVYTVRQAIYRAVKNQINIFEGCLLDVGCGVMPYKEDILNNNNRISKYIGLDLKQSNFHDTRIADVQWDGKTIPFNDNSFDSMIATEVLEHSFDPVKSLKEMNRVLKKDGLVFFTVPFIWPLHEVPYDAYRYTPYSLENILKEASFTDIKIYPLGGWNTALAQMIGLYVSENRKSKYKQNIQEYFAIKIIKYLLARENKKLQFKHHFMPSGLYGIARKLN